MHHAINEYQLRLDAQRFLWPVNYIALFILRGSFILHLIKKIAMSIEHATTLQANNTRVV